MFDDFVLTAAGLKLLYAAAAILMLVYLSRWLDSRASKAINHEDAKGFGAAIALIRTNPLAAAIYYGLRLLALAVVVGMLMGCSQASAGVAFPDRYDRDIRKAVAAWWPDYPHWFVWKAQLFQESRLDPDAVSPVGARGLAQFMPGTWDQVRRELRLGSAASPHHDIAIEAGAYYMARLRKGWSSPRPQEDRQQLAQASYNAGMGNLLKAQRACGGPNLYAEIIACLPDITGRHSTETITYVDRIARWRAMIQAGL